MKIVEKTEDDFPACGNWPANTTYDIRTARERLLSKDALGDAVYLIGYPAIMSGLRGMTLAHSGCSYLDFLLNNKLIDEWYEIKYGNINLPKDSVLVYSYRIDLSDYPNVALAFHSVEITNIYLV